MGKSLKERHPLYHSWAWMKKMTVKFEMDPSWKTDFYQFVQDMGERPSPQHRLYRKDLSLGYSKDNCYWGESIPCKDRAEWMREYRKQNPDKFKGYELKRRLNLSLEDYEQMQRQHDNKCAICKESEKDNPSLSVDHCHTTGKVRGLLCTRCNRGLGLFKDSQFNLEQAIAYLQQYA